jgi:hypothetical protein
VRSVIDERTGDFDFHAFRSRDEAITCAKEAKSTVVDWLIVMQQARLTEANAGKRGEQPYGRVVSRFAATCLNRTSLAPHVQRSWRGGQS